MKWTRRALLGGVVALGAALAGRAFPLIAKRGRRRPIRPPGAVPEQAFLSKCIRCYQCGDVCPNSCIEFHGLDDGLSEVGTPFIDPRSQACTACMKCTQVCPTGALQPQSAELDQLPGKIKMGVARLNRDMCYSWTEPARTCGVCYRACPFPGVAMKIHMFERPEIVKDMCIGCGLCEQACIHLPQAVRIVPIDREESA